MTDLTYSEAVEMLERLKGKVVLGPWEPPNEFLPHYRRTNLNAFMEKYLVVKRIYAGGRYFWVAGSLGRFQRLLLPEWLQAFTPERYHDTAEEAMQKADLMLRTLPSVVAAGIH